MKVQGTMLEPGDSPEGGEGVQRSSYASVILPSLVLSLQLAVYGLVGTLPMLTFWLPWRESANAGRFRVDVTRNETVFLDESYATTASFVMGYTVYASMPMFTFIPAVISACLRLPWRQIVALFFVTPFAAVAYTLAGRRGTSSPLLTGPLMVCPYPFQWALLRYRLCPPGSKVPATMIWCLAVLFMAFVLLNAIEFLSTSHKGLVVYIVVPIGKEAANFVFRTMARSFILDANAGGAGVKLRRSPAWALVLASNLTFAMYTRLLFSRERSTVLRGLMVAYQCATEVLLRLTVRWRDTQIRRWKRKLRLFGRKDATSRRRSTTIVAPSILAGSHVEVDAVRDQKTGKLMRPQLTAQSLEGVTASLKYFYANIVIIEALCEYTAIYMTALYIHFFKGDVLALPLEYFITKARLFDEPIDSSSLLLWVLTQALAELAVDTICGAAEMYKDGLPLLAAWRGRAQGFGLWFAFASWLVQVLMTGILQPDNFAACLGDDMCLCANNNGLQPGGVRDLYCARLQLNLNESAVLLP